MKINKKKWCFEVLILMLVMSVSLISAFGIAPVYTANNPLEISPGQEKDIQIFVGSSPVEGDLVIKAELIDSAGIATLKDRNLEYEVASGTEVPINIKIDIADDAVIGEKKSVTLKFSDITPTGNEGMVSVTGTQTASFVVSIVAEAPEEPEEGISTVWYWVIGIIVVIAIIWFIVKKKK